MKALLQARGVSSLVVLPNWADGAAIHPLPAADNPLRAEWSLAGRFVVGYSGNLGRVHDSSAIVDAAGGYAAFTLFPASASVLTVEYKVNLLAPARGPPGAPSHRRSRPCSGSGRQVSSPGLC